MALDCKGYFLGVVSWEEFCPPEFYSWNGAPTPELTVPYGISSEREIDFLIFKQLLLAYILLLLVLLAA